MTEELFDQVKAHREHLRWNLLAALEAAGHIGASESLLLTVVAPVATSVTAMEIKHELYYLQDRGLVKVDRNQPCWHATITADGADVAQYTVDCPPGIARPQKYW